MKAITIKQPWASLIVHGIKDIENRSWACPWKYIGHRVLIHASGKPVEMRNPNSVFTKAQWDSLPIEFQRKIICAEGIVNSAIIGSVEIIGCSINHPSKWAEKTDECVNNPTLLRKYIKMYVDNEEDIDSIIHI